MTTFEVSKLNKSQRFLQWMLFTMISTLFVAAGNSCLAQTSQMVVWAHSNPSSTKDSPYWVGGVMDYGTSYPLYINNTTLRNQMYAATGIDLLAFNAFITLPPTSYTGQMNGAATNHFLFSMCLDGNAEPSVAAATADAIPWCEKYYTDAINNPGAYKYNGKPVIFTYNDFPSGMDWSAVTAQCASDGKPISLVNDVSGTYLTNSGSLSQNALDLFANLAGPADQIYSFGVNGGVTGSFNGMNFMSGALLSGKTFPWTMQPGYYKSSSGGWRDAEGTGLLQDQWATIFQYVYQNAPGHCNGAFISTLDDFDEETYVVPSSTWNFTRSDLCAWYSSVLHNSSPPFTSPRQYLTVPQMMYNGLNYTFEWSCINPTNRPVIASIKIINSNSTQVGSSISGYVAVHSVGRAVYTVTNNSSLLSSARSWGVPFVQMQCVLTYADNGDPITTTLSPPVAVTTVASPYTPARTEYFSIASNKSLDTGYRAGHHVPTGSVNITSAGNYSCTMTPETGLTGSGNVCAGLDLLHDTRLEDSTLRLLDAGQNPTYVRGASYSRSYTPLNSPKDDRGEGTTDYNYYIIRERTVDGHEVYSDPFSATHNN